MWPTLVVVLHPGIQDLLGDLGAGQRRQGGHQLLAQGLVEPLDLAGGGRGPDPGQPVGDAVLPQDPLEQHLGRAGLAKPAGELLTVIGQDLLRHPVASQRRRQPPAHRPAGRSHHDLRAHAIARVVIDPGQHLDLGAVGKRDLHQVQLPQLHWPCTFPPPVRPLAASAPRGDQPVAHQQSPDRRAAGQWHDPSPLQLVPKPLRPPPGMLAAQLAHPGLDRCGQLVRAPVGPMGAVGQPLKPTSPVPGDPGVDRLAADPVAVGDLGHRQPRFQHLQHRVVALLCHAALPQHLSASCPRRRTPHTSKPSGGVKHQPKHSSSISRSRRVKHQPQQHTRW